MRRRSGPGRHTGSISEPQRPRAFHRGGDGGPGRRTESEAEFPRLLVPPPGSGLELPQQAMERVSCGGCEHRLWTQTQSCRLGQTLHLSEPHFLQNVDQRCPVS